MEPVTLPSAPELRPDSPRWTDWGFPPRRTVTCTGCGQTVPRLYSEGTDIRPSNHPDPAAPEQLCAASPLAILAASRSQADR